MAPQRGHLKTEPLSPGVAAYQEHVERCIEGLDEALAAIRGRRASGLRGLYFWGRERFLNWRVRRRHHALLHNQIAAARDTERWARMSVFRPDPKRMRVAMYNASLGESQDDLRRKLEDFQGKREALAKRLRHEGRERCKKGWGQQQDRRMAR